MQKQLPINRRILIVDDNQSIHDAFYRILCAKANADPTFSETEAALFGAEDIKLMSCSFEADSAYQGQEALEIVRQVRERNPYALAFVDVRMPPGWDGIETVRRLWEVDPDLHVVLCSAYNDYTWKEIADTVGESDRLLILKKPFDAIEVRQLATALTTKWSLMRHSRLHVSDLESLVKDRTLDLHTKNETLEQEICKRMSAEEQLRHDALHDALTGLSNRTYFLSRVSDSLQRSIRKTDYRFAVLFVDLDNFKRVNDTLGHAAGDAVLKRTAVRLTKSLRLADAVARVSTHVASRIGGDEFAILLDDLCSATDALRVVERIEQALSKPFRIAKRRIVISASVGISLSNGQAKTAEDLIREADTAMYRAKQAGKAGHALFDEEMLAAAKTRLTLENDLRTALAKNELVLQYQPIVDLETGLLCSFEALVRWCHPKRGMIPPAEFIPIAEETGLVVPLGSWVLKSACEQARKWHEEFPAARSVSVSVNVSKRELMNPCYVQNVSQIFAEVHVDASRINLEITESVLVGATQEIIQSATKLKELGVSLHMDDFGTGYSSLSCLHRFPVDVVKMDRSFVREMNSRQFAAVMHAVIGLALNLNLRVVAEGIETKEELASVLALHCHMAQGYFFSQPLEVSAATDLLRSGASPGWMRQTPLNDGSVDWENPHLQWLNSAEADLLHVDG